MTITPVIPGLHQLVVPTPFPVGPVNVYLAGGDEPPFDELRTPLTLIDTGPRTDQARAALEAGLATLGYALSDVGRIIITHAHADHYGLAGDVAQASRASVYAHPYNQLALEDYAAERARRRVFYDAMLAEAGVPEQIRAAVGRMTQGYGRYATAVSPVRALEQGDEIELAGQVWQVLFMPGHAGGLICLYQPQSRLLLSNDHLLRDISSNPLFEPPLPGRTRRRSLVDYVASLERTAALEVAVAWPGHGEPIHDHRALIEKRLAFHRRRADKLLAILVDGPQTVYGLSQALFSKVNGMDYFLVTSEVLAHLEWLEAQGAVVSQRQDDLLLWRRE